MTIIAIMLNKSGSFTLLADRLVGSKTEELFNSITLLHKLASYPNVLPSFGEN